MRTVLISNVSSSTEFIDAASRAALALRELGQDAESIRFLVGNDGMFRGFVVVFNFVDENTVEVLTVTETEVPKIMPADILVYPSEGLGMPADILVYPSDLKS